MRATSRPDHRPATAGGEATGLRELARLRRDVLVALGMKVLALALIGFLFFGPSRQWRIDPAALFSASPSTMNR
jgi:hypothetical protein